MHNGIEVEASGYYGDGITRMLVANRGCHEPQEEIVFQHVLNSLPVHAVMIEVGAYWAFYSIWFAKTVPDAQLYLIEPEEVNLNVGKRNFAHNNCKGEFTRGYVGARPGKAADGVQIIALDEFTAERALDHVHMLHADVQSFELEMLDGCKRLLSMQAVDYLFISTHSQDLHRQCTERLVQHGYRILASVDLEESYSVDGILVACSPAVNAPVFDPPSRKKSRSLSA
ncbi:MAG: FkbM family methyltransferase [Prosthecobacter sp.]|nr:FkbM family methyltransferase [Prosthecobacter sp.]